MSINKIALIGATGNLGPAILKGLLDGGYEVTILTREGSTSTDSLSNHPRQKITKVNFEDEDSIISGLKGIEGVVSNVASHSLLSQKKVIDAAIKAGVMRFLPSDFGSDLEHKANAEVLFNQPKVEVNHYVQEKARAHPEFSWTSVVAGPFFDWGLRFGIFGNLKNHDMTLWDGGETKISTTTLPSVGKTVAGIFKNLEATKNKFIRVADTTITQKEIIEIVKEIDGQEWTTKPGSTVEALQAGMEEMKKPKPNMQIAVVNQLYGLIFNEKYGVSYEDKLDNDVVGLPVMTREQVKEVIKSCMA